MSLSFVFLNLISYDLYFEKKIQCKLNFFFNNNRLSHLVDIRRLKVIRPFSPKKFLEFPIASI